MDRTVMLVGRRVVAWLVAAVVTVGLVAGGVLVARGGRDRAPAVLPALDLAAGQPATADAAAEPAPARRDGAEPAGASDTAVPQLWAPVTYRLQGPLPDLPDQARAWKVGDDPGAGRVAALAAALGLRGRPTEEPSGWTVSDGERVLTVNRLAGAPWTYGVGVFGPCLARSAGTPTRPGAVRCPDPDAPVASEPGAAPGDAGASGSGTTGSGGSRDPGAAGSGAAGSGGSASSPGNPGPGRPVVPPVTVKPVAPARPLPPPDRPSRELAERVARELAARAGLALDGAEVRVADAYATRVVTISPAVGGAATSGFAWTVGVGAGGRIQHAGGYLATPEPADTYPLIGVDEGYERLKRSPPLGPLLRGAEAPAVAPAIEHDPCTPGGRVPCTAKPLPERVATVTGVRLGLQLAPAVAKGREPAHLAYLLPAYLFDLEGGWTDVRAVVAVQDRYLTRP